MDLPPKTTPKPADPLPMPGLDLRPWQAASISRKQAAPRVMRGQGLAGGRARMQAEVQDKRAQPAVLREAGGRLTVQGVTPARARAERAAPARPEAAEIVYIIRDFQLLDPESYQRTYRRLDGRALARGYYIVTWPAGKDAGSYGEDAAFLGPFRQRRAAEEHLRARRQRPVRCAD